MCACFLCQIPIMKVVALFIALVASCSAFAPATAMRPAVVQRAAAMRVAPAATMLEAQDTWWGDKDYPDSIVLGIGKDAPSGFYAVTSVVLQRFPQSWSVPTISLRLVGVQHTRRRSDRLQMRARQSTQIPTG